MDGSRGEAFAYNSGNQKKVLLDFPVVWILCSVKRVLEAEIDKGDWQLTLTKFFLVYHAMIWEVRKEKVAILNLQSARNPEQLNFPLRELKKEKWMTESSSLKLYFLDIWGSFSYFVSC